MMCAPAKTGSLPLTMCCKPGLRRLVRGRSGPRKKLPRFKVRHFEGEISAVCVLRYGRCLPSY